MIIFLAVLKMLGLTILQNASFTLVSRARNSSSIAYHGGAAVLSNGIWLLVIREVTLSFDKWYMMAAYVVGAVTGSILMHYVAMKYFEKGKRKPTNEIAPAEPNIYKVSKHTIIKKGVSGVR